jgi:hypothetical protein
LRRTLGRSVILFSLKTGREKITIFISMSKTTKSILILLSIVLFVVGIIIFSDFVSWFLIKGEGIKYITSGMADQFKYTLLFSLVVAAIPLVPFLLHLKTKKSILISTGLLTAFIITVIMIKRFLLLSDINKFHFEIPGEKIETHLSLSNSLPIYYMLAALLAGVLVLSILKSQKILFKEELAI